MKKRKKEKHVYGIIAFAAAAVFAVNTVFAESPEFSRTPEEWEHLRDNVLEFYEIPALIHEYNVTVLENRDKFDRSEDRDRTAESVKNNLYAQADDYDALAEGMEGTSGYEMAAANYRIQAATLRENALDGVDDAETLRLGYDKIEAELVSSARDMFIAYYASLEKLKSAKESAGYAERAYRSALAKQSVGAGTEMETLSAKKRSDELKAAIITAETDAESSKKALAILCGWKYADNAVIAPLPDFDTGLTDAVNYEEDLKKATENSFTLRSDRKKLLNSENSTNLYSTREKYKKQLENDTDTLNISFKNSYDTLKNTVTAYINAQSAMNISEADYKTAKRKLSQGSVSEAEVSLIESAYMSSKSECELSRLQMMTAYYDYIALTEGVG